MQEFITIRLPKEEYSQLIAKSVQLDFYVAIMIS